MRHTLNAVFDQRSDAQHVLDELLASGYSSAEMAPSSVPLANTPGLHHKTASAKHAISVPNSILDTASRLLASWQHKLAMPDPDATMRERHMVTLTTDSEPGAARAIDIIERFRPVSIGDVPDEAASNVVDEGMHGAATGVGGMRSIYPPGTEPGALQYGVHEDSRYFGTQSAESPPTGNTFQEAAGTTRRWAELGDDATAAGLTTAWISAANGSEEDDRSAFSFGKVMRNRYRNLSWSDAESRLDSEWDARAPGPSTWEEFKSAVRRGWDSTTPDIDDDSDYRTHWNRRYASSADDADYDDYTPAYNYGSEARRSEKYRSRDWRDAEPDLRADWETRHPGQLSAWNNFKHAVMHGWNRVKPEMDDEDAANRSGPAKSGAGGDHHGSNAVHEGDDRDRLGTEVNDKLASDSQRRHAGDGPSMWNRVKAAMHQGGRGTKS